MSKKQKSKKVDPIMHDGWGEVDTISKTCRQRLGACSVVIPVVELFQKKPELVAKNPEAIRACKALMEDVPAMRAELDVIGQQHKNKTGDIVEADDFLVTIEVSQLYSTWLDRFERLIDPNLELVAGAIDQLKTEESPA